MLSMFSDMHEIWGAAGMPVSRWILNTVSRVLARVEPPAPKVTDMYSGLSAASRSRVRLNSSTCSPFFGGKNSKLNWGVVMASFASNSKAGIKIGDGLVVVVRAPDSRGCDYSGTSTAAHRQRHFSRLTGNPGPVAGPGVSKPA